MRLRWLLVPLRVIAAVLLIVALARPQIGHAAFETVAQGIDIVLAIDTSSSMNANDFGSRNKLEVTKTVIREFLGGLKDHRVGSVIFSGAAMVLSPLSLDYEAARRHGHRHGPRDIGERPARLAGRLARDRAAHRR